MKLTNIALATVLSLGMVSLANADAGSGKVNFEGKIIDAPCSIAPESIDQTKSFGQVANVELVNGGKSTNVVNFDIKLQGCDISSKNKVQVTFAGPNGGATGTTNTLLAITGAAKGASIAMFDGSNQPITLGTATTVQNLIAGNNTLSFTAFLQGHAGTTLTDIVEGDFTSTTNFTMAYN
ncbi:MULTISPECIES: fimbrial protein [Serratia]|uniref:fimbrial protein n=1 Tax=Serratia TaxID=613 RepID=UPI0003AC658A|nr:MULTISPECIES: fimbrial protein [Serratia]ERK09858.1 P pilus assembly protein, pilin FimA [Serratia fonticola AU-AP2C]ERK12708.1 P pilus assembly protein, pilin FimA [Serratia fonticola AU-P3(3)]ATM76884.1 fimbria A protein [Serratia fonticola]MBP0997704.1 fimbrial protein [Serratia fonticola]MBP1001792.1 fimbrial protein [Serratia fonticola]